MMDFQTIAAVIFLIILTLFVFLKRRNLETKQIIPYFLYFSMYKTTWGIRLMDSVARKYSKYIVNILSVFSLAMILYSVGQIFLQLILRKFDFLADLLQSHPIIFTGLLFICFILISLILLLFFPLHYRMSFVSFIGMIIIGGALFLNFFLLFTKPETAQGVGLVLPIKAKGIFYVPFFYWMISIFLIAVVHEFAHGLVARMNNLKVKSSGFAFIGLVVPIIPAAFVEPDEKELRKRQHKQQLSVFAAGPLANMATAFLALAVLSFIIVPLTNAVIEPNGIKFAEYYKGNKTYPAESAGIKIGEIIQEIDNKPTPYLANMTAVLSNKKPGDIVKIKTDKAVYELKLEENPSNESAAFMGISQAEQSTKIKDDIKNKYGEFLPNSIVWITGLFIFLYILNLGIGLFNLVPIGPLDGGRMLQLPLQRFFGAEKGNKIFVYISLVFFIIIIMNLGAGFGLFNLFK